jgi:hypothetical protein
MGRQALRRPHRADGHDSACVGLRLSLTSIPDQSRPGQTEQPDPGDGHATAISSRPKAGGWLSAVNPFLRELYGRPSASIGGSTHSVTSLTSVAITVFYTRVYARRGNAPFGRISLDRECTSLYDYHTTEQRTMDPGEGSMVFDVRRLISKSMMNHPTSHFPNSALRAVGAGFKPAPMGHSAKQSQSEEVESVMFEVLNRVSKQSQSALPSGRRARATLRSGGWPAMRNKANSLGPKTDLVGLVQAMDSWIPAFAGMTSPPLTRNKAKPGRTGISGENHAAGAPIPAAEPSVRNKANSRGPGLPRRFATPNDSNM